MQKIMIHGKLPTANEYIDACRKNRYAAAKMKRDAEELIIWQAKRLLPIKQKVRIRLTWYESNRRRDHRTAEKQRRPHPSDDGRGACGVLLSNFTMLRKRCKLLDVPD